MTTATAHQAFNRVQQQAETIRNDQTAAIETMSIGDVLRQGDIYITRIKALPGGAKRIKERQLAPGDTQGSRHVLQGDVDIYTADPVFAAKAIGEAVGGEVNLPSPLIGPVFRVKQTATVTHPEHGDRVLPKGVYATTFQRQHAVEVQRAAD